MSRDEKKRHSDLCSNHNSSIQTSINLLIFFIDIRILIKINRFIVFTVLVVPFFTKFSIKMSTISA